MKQARIPEKQPARSERNTRAFRFRRATLWRALPALALALAALIPGVLAPMTRGDLLPAVFAGAPAVTQYPFNTYVPDIFADGRGSTGAQGIFASSINILSTDSSQPC